MQPQYEIVTTTAGAISIRDNLVNEIMHNPVGPWVEASALYVEQPKLRERILNLKSPELVIFDIGLGAGTNAIAALKCFLDLPDRTHQRIKVVSFERNLDLLRFALSHSQAFDFFKGFEVAVNSLLNDGRWEAPHLIWELRFGDFLELLETESERPHIIFFDPYSPKMNQEVWTTRAFQKIFSIRRSKEQGATILYTYSQATPVRSAMLLSGFFVGHGQGTGLKMETTQAATQIDLLDFPLGEKWLLRWQKSQTPLPYDAEPMDHSKIAEAISGHSQFS